MSKKERFRKVLVGLLEDLHRTRDEERILEFLASNSNLPGPRGNLELAHAFAEACENFSAIAPEEMWTLASKLASIPASEAPVNDPKEFLSFCGAVAAGAVGSVRETYYEQALALLRKLSVDSRWRMREGVAMGIQRLIAARGQDVLSDLCRWILDDDWLTMRAVAAGVSEPALLGDERIAEAALELHKTIFDRILTARQRKTDDFKTLRQALGYSLSVVTCALPEQGFRYLQQLADSKDADIMWVLRENLKKNRLIKRFPVEVARIAKLV